MDPAAPVVAVIGPGDAGEEVARAAEELGRALARAGARVVTGGLGGAMEAASRGARAEGGRVTAILPGTDRRDATPHADAVVATGMGEARDLAVVASADAVVAVGGGWGTLAEIGLARRLGRPVVLLGSWRIAGPDGAAPEGVVVASGPEDAAARALGGGR